MSDSARGTPDLDPALARYSRQILFAPLGIAGQKRLIHSRVTLLGCGALGSSLAGTLVRAGVGFVRIIDRDFVELHNLQRQVLFDESDVSGNLPKAEAAARKLRKINSAVEVEAIVADANAGNLEKLCDDVELILDGTDNFETRFLINDVAVKLNVPWVYGACIGAEGLVLPILPRETPCLRCIWEDAPPPGSSPTCDTAGVLGPIAGLVASLQAIEAIKILAGKTDALVRRLVTIDAWDGRIRHMDVQSARDNGNCPCCKQGRYDFLTGARTSATTSLCGRNAVQVLPAEGVRVNLREMAERLRRHRPTVNEFLLRVAIESFKLTLFPDGRAIIQGTADAAVARGVYAKYIGS